MIKSVKTLITGLFLISSVMSQAQGILSLSIDSAINFALSHNKTLVNSKLAVDHASQKLRETIAAGLPQVSATVDYTNYLGAEASFQMSETMPPAVIEFNPTSNFTASASQLIFSGSYFVGVQLTKLAKTMTEQRYLSDEADVKELTIQAYYTILVSERLLNLVKENKTQAQLIFEKTNNMAKAGLIETIEAKKLSVMVASAENATKSVERQVEMGYNLLRLQLGLDSDTPVKLTTGLEDISQRFVVRSADNFNVKKNLNYQLVETQGKMAEKNIDLAKAGYLPTLVSFYSYTEKIKKPLFDISPKNVLGFSLNIPVFSSGERMSKLNQAKIDYRINENTRNLLTQQLTLQARQLSFNYNNLMEQYLNQKANVEVAREVLEKLNLKYEQGLISSLELTSANTEYISAESSYTSTLLQLLFAELQIRKLNNEL